MGSSVKSLVLLILLASIQSVFPQTNPFTLRAWLSLPASRLLPIGTESRVLPGQAAINSKPHLAPAATWKLPTQNLTFEPIDLCMRAVF